MGVYLGNGRVHGVNVVSAKGGINVEHSFKPLTPNFRNEINDGFNAQIAELQTCKPSALVNVQIEALRMYKRLINSLPDGYPMPINTKEG